MTSLSRKEFLHLIAVGLGTLVGGRFLAACENLPTVPATTQSPSNSPTNNRAPTDVPTDTPISHPGIEPCSHYHIYAPAYSTLGYHQVFSNGTQSCCSHTSPWRLGW